MPYGSAARVALPVVTDGLLAHIRMVIKATYTPSWVGSVPSNIGDASAGKLKADEWRQLFTIYLPLALVSKWGEGSDHPSSAVARRSRELLDHTMELVSAVSIACARTTSHQKAQRYEGHIREYLRTMRDVHPNINISTNMHMASHIQEFMRLFGPTFSWWCFPFERLIGFLQRMPNNGKIGQPFEFDLRSHSDCPTGQLETSIHEQFIAFSRVKLWSSRPDCPAIIRECRSIYDRLYPDNAARPIVDDDVRMKGPEDEEDDEWNPRRCRRRIALPRHLQGLLLVSSTVRYARHLHNGVLYSITACHVGNSLVLVHPGGASSKESVPGIIEDICLNEHDEIVYVVRLYTTSRSDLRDPFRFYPDFPARAYSADLSAKRCIIRPQWVVGHFARYQLRPDVIAVLSLSKVSDHSLHGTLFSFGIQD